MPSRTIFIHLLIHNHGAHIAYVTVGILEMTNWINSENLTNLKLTKIEIFVHFDLQIHLICLVWDKYKSMFWGKKMTP